jgi:hypothetical protein
MPRDRDVVLRDLIVEVSRRWLPVCRVISYPQRRSEEASRLPERSRGSFKQG